MENYTDYQTDQTVENDAVIQYRKLLEKLNTDSENFNYITNHMPPKAATTDAYIKGYLASLSEKQLKSRADGLIKAQKLKEKNGDMIEHMADKSNGNFHHFRSQWTPILWQSRENNDNEQVKIGNKIVNAGDLDFSIAESLEEMDATRDPVTEYYDWVKIQKNIETSIYTDGTTETEIDARNFFIAFMDKRETEIKRIVDLYAGCALNANSPLQQAAQEKLKFTVFKLNELRRLRERMSKTKSRPNKTKESELKKQQKEEKPNDIMDEYIKYQKMEQENQNNEVNEELLKNASEFICNYCLQNHMDHQHLDEGLGETLIQFRPVSHNLREAINKMNSAEQNHSNLRETLNRLRGIAHRASVTQEVSEETIVSNSNTNRVQMLRGFNKERYIQYQKELHNLTK